MMARKVPVDVVQSQANRCSHGRFVIRRLFGFLILILTLLIRRVLLLVSILPQDLKPYMTRTEGAGAVLAVVLATS